MIPMVTLVITEKVQERRKPELSEKPLLSFRRSLGKDIRKTGLEK